MQRRTLNNKSSIGPNANLAHDLKHYYPYGPYYNKTVLGNHSTNSHLDANINQNRNKKKELQIRQINHKVQLFNRYLNEPQVDLNQFKNEDGKLKLQISLNNNNNNNNKSNQRSNNVNNKRKGNNNAGNSNHGNENNLNINIIETTQSILTPKFSVKHSTLSDLQKNQDTTTMIENNHNKTNSTTANKPLLNIMGLDELPIYQFNDFINHSDMILSKLQKRSNLKNNIRTINTNPSTKTNNAAINNITSNADTNNILAMDDSIQFNDSFELSFDGKAIDRSDIFRMVDSFSVAFDEDDEEDPRVNRFNNKNILTDDIIN